MLKVCLMLNISMYNNGINLLLFTCSCCLQLRKATIFFATLSKPLVTFHLITESCKTNVLNPPVTSTTEGDQILINEVSM